MFQSVDIPAVTLPDAALTDDLAQQMHALARQLSQQPGFGAHKVARLQAAVASGDYQVKTPRLAHTLYRFEFEEEIDP